MITIIKHLAQRRGTATVVPPDETVVDFEGKTVIFYGDSITWGYGLSDRLNDRYTTLLMQEANGGTEVNNGVSGQVMEDISYGGRSMFDYTQIPTKTAAHKYLFIALGVNDIDNPAGGFTTAGFITKYRATLTHAATKGWAMSDIVLLTPFYFLRQSERQTAYRDAVAQVAGEKGTILADVHTAMANTSGINAMIPDNIHPNEAGHEVIKDFLLHMDYTALPANPPEEEPEEPAGPVLLTGTVFGTTGYGGFEPAKAFDGSVASTFAGAGAANQVRYVGIDLGTGNEKAIVKVRLYPRSGYAVRVQGTVFQGGNTSQTTGFTDLQAVGTTPVNAEWYEWTISNPTPFRYLRLYAPNTVQYFDVAEVEFYGE